MSKITVNDIEDKLVEAKAWMLRTQRINFQYYGMDDYNADVIKSFENLTLEEVLKARYRFILNVGEDGVLNGMDMINVFDTVEKEVVEFGLFALHAYDKGEDVFVGKTIDITILASLINAGEYNAYIVNADTENNISTYHIHSRCFEVIDTALKRYENTDKLYMEIFLRGNVDEDIIIELTTQVLIASMSTEDTDIKLIDDEHNTSYIVTIDRSGNEIKFKQVLAQVN